MNPQKLLMRSAEPVDELLNRAFGLAYFILGDRPASIYVAMGAMDKLKTALSNQGRRQYYTPTGRSAYPASRTKVNLSELHLLQRLVYVESELFERLIEGQRGTLQQDDLVIRYVKHLIRLTTKHNSFYVTLGLFRLLYNYSTADTAEIYNLVLQDPDRIRDDYYYRSRKKRLMEDITERFGNLIKIQRGLRREDRFQPQENSLKYARLVRECLTRFTPWQSDCVLPTTLDPNRNVITPLLFQGTDPDQEHEIEVNRMHTLIHPECVDRITAALGLDSVDERLELPHFFIPSDGPRPSEDRFHPTGLTEEELVAMKRYLEKSSVNRKQFSPSPACLMVDGRRQADFLIEPSQVAEFDLADGAELVEIRSAPPIDAGGDASLAVWLLSYGRSGVLSSNSVTQLSQEWQLSLGVAPLADVSGEAYGSRLRISCEAVPSRRAVFPSLLHSWREAFGGRMLLAPLRVGLACLVILASALGLWLFFSAKQARNSSQIAQTQPDRNDRAPAINSSSPAVDSKDLPPGGNETRGRATAPVVTGAHDQTVASTNDLNRVRGVRPKLASPGLSVIKRVYVDPLGDDSFSSQLRESLIKSLQNADRFIVTNERNEADAVFRVPVRPEPRAGDQAVPRVLELVNARGKTVWSTSLPSVRTNPNTASALIMKRLQRQLRMKDKR